MNQIFQVWGLGRDLLDLLCVTYCDKHRGWSVDSCSREKGHMSQSQSSVCGSGLPLPSTHMLPSSHPKVSCWRLQPMGLRAFCLDFFLHHVLVPQWLSQALQRPTCFQKHGDTRSHLVHCSHRGFCLSSSPVLCHHLLTQTSPNLPAILKLSLTASRSSHSSFSHFSSSSF